MKTFVMLCVIWYHLYNFKNMKNTQGGVLMLVKLQALAFNFTKSNTPPWVFFTFFKLYNAKSRNASHLMHERFYWFIKSYTDQWSLIDTYEPFSIRIIMVWPYLLNLSFNNRKVKIISKPRRLCDHWNRFCSEIKE